MDLYNTKFIFHVSNRHTTLRMTITISARTTKETDKAKEALAADAAVIVIRISETTHLLIKI